MERPTRQPHGQTAGGNLSEIQSVRSGAEGGLPQIWLSGSRDSIEVGGRSNGAEPDRGEQVVCRGPQRLMSTTLLNTGNCCYMSTCAIGLFWLGECAGITDAAYGSVKPGLMLLRGGAVSLARALSWLTVFQHWQDVDIQHDAAEFFKYFLEQAIPIAFNGGWESRTELMVPSALLTQVRYLFLYRCHWLVSHYIVVLMNGGLRLFLMH